MRINLFKDNRGMTLIEVLLAIAIIGIIVVTFLPIITSSFINVVNSGNRSQSMYDSSGKIEEAIAKRESIDLEGEFLIFQSAYIPIKFNNIPVKYVSGGKVIKNEIAAFITDVPTLNFDPYFLYEGYLDGQRNILVNSLDIRFLISSTYKINGLSFAPIKNNDNQIKLVLPIDATAWKNEYSPYKFEVQTGLKSAKGIIQILQPKAMVVGSTNTIKISSDISNGYTTWRDRSFSNTGLNSVKYIDSLIGKGYIAVGNEGKIVNLYDGSGWKNINHNLTTEDLTDIAYGNRNLLVVGTNGTILHSVSKDIWNIINVLGLDKNLKGVDFGLLAEKEYFVAVGDNGAWLRWDMEKDWVKIDWDTIDSITKDEIESQIFNDIQAISYTDKDDKLMTMFVAVGTNGSIAFNSILVEGEANENWFYSKFTSNKLNAISFNKDNNNPVLVAVGDNGTILYSDNASDNIGQNWMSISTTISGIGKAKFNDIQYLEGKFLAIGNNTDDNSVFLITSIDGKNWTKTNTSLGTMVINGISGY